LAARHTVSLNNGSASVTKKITIPMPGKTESLNAAVAGSIAAYLAFTYKNSSRPNP